jgi:hypothetical protein
MLAVMALARTFPLERLAQSTSLATLTIFAVVNLSLLCIRLRYTQSNTALCADNRHRALHVIARPIEKNHQAQCLKLPNFLIEDQLRPFWQSSSCGPSICAFMAKPFLMNGNRRYLKFSGAHVRASRIHPNRRPNPTFA